MKPVMFRNGIPSNFYPDAPFYWECPARGREVEWSTTEHLFHVYKVAICHLGTIDMADAIREAESPHEAKVLGGQVPLDTDEIDEWDRYFAPMAMLTANLQKFHQNPECAVWLLSTGDAPLIEDRADPIWGRGADGKGKNQLGKTLELVRATLK